MRVLIIEDNPEIVEAISLAFQIGWPQTELVSTHLGEEALELLESEAPDVVILDLGLPDISGFEVLKQVRLFSTVPVIILTVRAEEADIVKGLEWGADDYVVKPFRQLELLARVKAITGRRVPQGKGPVLACGPLSIDTLTRRLVYREKEISVTATEAHIIHRLIENAGQVVTHSSLAEVVWGDDYPGAANSLKVHIWRLRQKVEADPSHPQLILTKPGIGYSLATPS